MTTVIEVIEALKTAYEHAEDFGRVADWIAEAASEDWCNLDEIAKAGTHLDDLGFWHCDECGAPVLDPANTALDSPDEGQAVLYTDQDGISTIVLCHECNEGEAGHAAYHRSVDGRCSQEHADASACNERRGHRWADEASSERHAACAWSRERDVPC